MSEEKKTVPITREQMNVILQQAEGLRYGTLNLIFQDGVLIQIDRSEKMRFPTSGKGNSKSER